MSARDELLRLVELRVALSSGEARRLRESHDLSLGEIARAVGMDQATIWRWENGTRKPREGASALAYADLLADLRKRSDSGPANAREKLIGFALAATPNDVTSAKAEQLADAFAAEVLRDAAKWFEDHCPDGESEAAMDLCCCDSADYLRLRADQIERQHGIGGA